MSRQANVSGTLMPKLPAPMRHPRYCVRDHVRYAREPPPLCDFALPGMLVLTLRSRKDVAALVIFCGMKNQGTNVCSASLGFSSLHGYVHG